MKKNMKNVPVRQMLKICMCVLCGLLLCLTLSVAAEEEEEAKPTPKDWQLKGIFAALEDKIPEVQILALRKLQQFDCTAALSDEQIAKIAERADHDNTTIRAEALTVLGLLKNRTEPYLPKIVVRLADEDADVRSAAVTALGELGPVAAPALSDLIARLADEDADVRYAATTALGQLGPVAAPALSDLIARLADEDADVRYAATTALGQLGPVAAPALPDLIARLADEEGYVRKAAATALGQLGPVAAPALPDLIARLADEEGYVRKAAATALGRLGPVAAPALPDLIARLADEEWYVREAAVTALGQLGPVAAPALSDLVAYLTDEEGYVRDAAATALGQLGPVAAPALPDLIARLADEDADIRDAAATALGQLGPVAAPAFPDLIARLADEEGYVRKAAATALGRLGPVAAPALPDLIARLADEEWYVREAATTALGRLGPVAAPALPDLIARLADEEGYVRDAAATALGRLGPVAAPALPDLIARLADEEWYVREAATTALGRLGPVAAPALPDLIARLADEEWYVRDAAATALGRLGPVAAPALPDLIARLADEEGYVRKAAATALGRLGPVAAPALPDLIARLADEEGYVRKAAATALGQLGPVAAPALPDLVASLNDKNENVRFTAFQVLGGILFKKRLRYYDPDSTAANNDLGDCQLVHIPPIINRVYTNREETAERRFLAYFLGGGKPEIEILLNWIGKPEDNLPEKLAYSVAQRTLAVFHAVWEATAAYPDVRADLVEQMAVVIIQRAIHWKQADLPLLQTHLAHLEEIDSTRADSVSSVISSIKNRMLGKTILHIFLIHLLFWGLLLVLYPACHRFLAAWFWHPAFRLVAGLGYIHLLLTRIPLFRQRLFMPFRAALLTDAALKGFHETDYFPSSDVKRPGERGGAPIHECLPELSGQIILEGDSGLGKSMFIRHLLRHSKRVAVYLPAEKCSDGILSAIQNKLPHVVKDRKFLGTLIEQGAIDLYIDGLNEVSPGTRATIAQFVERNFRGNILLVTQPIDWTPPTAARTYILQPLRSDQIETFLLGRLSMFSDTISISAKEYEQRCNAFLADTLDANQPKEALDAARRILSNPMDLTIVAQMIAHDQQPNLVSLQEQQYRIMVGKYERLHPERTFPLARFSEQVYQMRLHDNTTLPHAEFFDELTCMEAYKMVISRQEVDDTGRVNKTWHFRHDKIMEFFIVQTFLEHHDRIDNHIPDPRFRGVYPQLATLLSLDDALRVRDQLLQYAVNHNDHLVSDMFIKSLRSREANAPELQTLRTFLEQAGVKILPWQVELGLRAVEAGGRLTHYTPLPVLAANTSVTRDDIQWLVSQASTLRPEKRECAGLLFYQDSPSASARLAMTEVRFNNNFIVIPIPFATAEQAISDKNACVGLLTDYTDRYLSGADLFDDRNAIGDSLTFFGRVDLLRRLREELLKRQPVGVFGLRKSGKTSVLFQLRFLLQHSPVVHIDLQLYGGKSRYGVTLFKEICSKLVSLVEHRNPKLLPGLQPCEVSETSQVSEVSIDFVNYLCKLAELLPRTGYELPIVCFLDEIERILPTPHDSREKVEEFNAFFGALRVLCQERRILSLLVADVHPDCNRINQWLQDGVPSNPVHNLFKEIFLAPFSSDETHTMITDIGGLMGREFDKETLDTLHEQSGGHPFIARQLASLVCKKISIETTRKICWDQSQRYLNEALLHSGTLPDYLDQNVWADLKKRRFDAAMSVLRELATHREGKTLPEFQAQFHQHYSQIRLTKALLWLEAVGLIVKEEKEQPERYRLLVPLLAQWLKMEGEV